MFKNLASFMVLASAFLLASVAHAETESADQPAPLAAPSQQLQNLIFFPHKNVLQIAPTLTVTTNDHASQNSSVDNSLNSSIDRRKTSFQVELIYGFTDRFRFGFIESELLMSNADTTDASTNLTTRTSAGGLSDPELSAIYRLAEFQGSGLYADLSLNYTPAIGSKVKMQPAQDGNNLQGGWSGSVSIPVYWFWGQNEFNLRGTLKESDTSMALGANGAQNTETSNYWSKTITVQDRFHFLLGRLYAQVGLIFSLPYSYANTTNGVSTSYEFKSSLKKVLTIGCLLNDQITVSAFIANSSVDSSTSSNSVSGNNNSRVDGEMGFNANFLF